MTRFVIKFIGGVLCIIAIGGAQVWHFPGALNVALAVVGILAVVFG